MGDDGAADRAGGVQRRRGLGLAGVGRRRELRSATFCTKSEPAAVAIGFERRDAHTAHEHHLLAGGLALAWRSPGAGSRTRVLRPHDSPRPTALYATGSPAYRFLLHKWYFDEAYDAAS